MLSYCWQEEKFLKRGSSKGLAEALRASRQQMTKNSCKSQPKKVVKSRGYNDAPLDKSYKYFLRKYETLTEEVIKTFGTRDLTYYFREKAKEAGFKYYISNYSRDCGIMKKLLKEYSAMDICLMIEFLFCDEQDYLDKSTLAPTILISGWNNTIYQDSVKWANNEYVPHKKRSKSKDRPTREWTQDKPEVKVGEW